VTAILHITVSDNRQLKVSKIKIRVTVRNRVGIGMCVSMRRVVEASLHAAFAFGI